MSSKRVIIFKEATQAEMPLRDNLDYGERESVVNYAEDLIEEDAAFDVVTYSDEEHPQSLEEDMSVKEYLEPLIDGESSLGDLGEELTDLDEEVESFMNENKELMEIDIKELIPGADISSDDIDEEETEVETDYANDGDLSKFMDYISDKYKSIPQHDGQTTVGCERATGYLERLNSEISRAIREDSDNVLDLVALEDIRVSIMGDIVKLKSHLSKLKKRLKDSQSKKAEASLPPAWKASDGSLVSAEDLSKVASTPRNIVIAVSPFERAISGIMINAHVSAGHPIEEVYKFLADKYSINEREELAIMQLCMDSGFHVFKDRGSYSLSAETEGSSKAGSGVDFVKNYFA